MLFAFAFVFNSILRSFDPQIGHDRNISQAERILPHLCRPCGKSNIHNQERNVIWTKSIFFLFLFFRLPRNVINRCYSVARS